MKTEKITLTIEESPNLRIFKNESNRVIEISLIPVKPKVKHELFMIIRPKEFITIEGKDYDLSQICFRFVNKGVER